MSGQVSRPATAWDRVRHIASGVLVTGAAILIALSIGTAAEGLHGYRDVLEFVWALAISVLLLSGGWRWSA